MIENIDTLRKLEKLFLGKNKIAKLEVCNQWYCHKPRQICLRTRGELSRSAVFEKNNLIFKTLFKKGLDECNKNMVSLSYAHFNPIIQYNKIKVTWPVVYNVHY